MSHQLTDAGAGADDQEASFARIYMLEQEQVSPEVRALARKNEATILRSVKNHGAGKVAHALGVSDSSFSRYLSDGRAGFATMLLAQLGLRIVPADATVLIQLEEYR